MNEDFHKTITSPGLTPPQKPEAPLEIPRKIGPYKIECLLQKGGMSILYLGTHPETQDPLVVKVLSPKYLSHTEAISRFKHEAEVLSQADDPSIVRIYGHGKWEGGWYIAMEFVQGISLRQYLLQNPISLKRAVELVIDIAYTLCHLHTRGIIHRDIKPENILITDLGNIKLIDFGIAQQLTEKKAPKEAAAKARLLGTPIYMSPEQKENPEAVSFPADIYSLGIIAYELVLGKLSYGQIHLSLMPKSLQKILSKALQLKPEERYQDIVDFIADLSAYLNSPTFQKEQKSGDRLSELSESLRQAQILLFPDKAPHWPGIEMGIANYKGTRTFGVFYDLFEVPGGYAILMGESSEKSESSILYAATIRGMGRALAQSYKSPSEFVSKLNEMLIHDTSRQIFTLCYLVLNPREDQFYYISCGHGHLWMNTKSNQNPIRIISGNIPLGIDPMAEFKHGVYPWKSGDLLILDSLTQIPATPEVKSHLSEDIIKKAVVENVHLVPQKQVEHLLRIAKTSSPEAILHWPISFISIQRHS
jgi:hypothetical protein